MTTSQKLPVTHDRDATRRAARSPAFPVIHERDATPGITRSFPLVATLAAVGALLVAGCGGGPEGGSPVADADTLTRRQKDSIVSTLPVPGAGAVGRALRASDQARERALAHDTIR